MKLPLEKMFFFGNWSRIDWLLFWVIIAILVAVGYGALHKPPRDVVDFSAKEYSIAVVDSRAVTTEECRHAGKNSCAYHVMETNLVTTVKTVCSKTSTKTTYLTEQPIN